MNKRRGRPPKYLSNPPKRRRKQSRHVSNPAPETKTYFQHLNDTEIKELLMEELNASAREYLAYGQRPDNMSAEEHESIRADFAEVISAIQPMAERNVISLNMLSKLMERFSDRQQ